MSIALQHAVYVERMIREALARGFAEDREVPLVQVAPAPWEQPVHAIIYVLDQPQQRIYL